jgi:hypothetical protein
MAALEVIKRLTSIRGYFHLYELQQVLSQEAISELYKRIAPPSSVRTADAPKPRPPALLPIWPRRQRRDLNADWFDIPLEQLVAQLGGLAQEQFIELYGSNVLRREKTRGHLFKSLTGVATGNDAGQNAQEPPDPDQVDTLRAQLELSLDRLQLLIGTRWRKIVRAAACVAAALFATGVTITTGTAPLSWTKSRVSSVARTFDKGFRDALVTKTSSAAAPTSRPV